MADLKDFAEKLVNLTVKEVESAKVTLKLVAETTSVEDKPNCNSACDMYEL